MAPRGAGLGLALVGAVLLGALAHGALVTPARASGDAITRGDVDRVVRALEAQAKATELLGREVRDAAKVCK